MTIVRDLDRKGLAGLLIALSILGIMFTSLQPKASAAPSGSYFDHIVIIAMENQNYANVLGTGTLAGCPIGTAPFLCSLLPLSSTIPNYHSYGASSSISGCSAGCYTAIVSGSDQGISDGYSCCIGATTLVDQMQSAGLTWQAYCESGCPRGNDHFAFTGFASDVNSPNVFTSSSVSTSTFISAANVANPPNLLWYTPTDNHNMHDNSISTGDSYLKSFLVGTGTISSPASGSLLGSSLFTSSSYRTLLYIWWDEYDPSPNLEIGFNGASVKTGLVSASNGYDEFASLHTIESNWGLACLANGCNAPIMSDVFGTSGPSPLTASFSYSPPNPTNASTIVFSASASGGTAPYSYSWLSGSSSIGAGTPFQVTLSAGTYTISLKVTDSKGASFTTQTQTLTVRAATGTTGGGVFDCTNWTCQNFVSPSTLSVNSNGTAEIRHSNPSVCDWTNSYYDSLIRGTPPPAQGPSQGAPLPSGIQQVSASATLLDRSLGPSCSGPSGSGPRYNLFMSLYFQLAQTVSACGTFSGASWLDTQVRVEDINGVDSSIGTTSTYGGVSDPGVGACGYSLAVLQLGVGASGTLIADVQTQCLQAEIAWGISPPGATTPTISCTLTGVEIGTEGFDMNALDTNWYNVLLSTGGLPSTLSCSFTYTPTSPSAGQTLSLTGSASGGTTPYSYSWNFGDGATSSGQTTSHAYTSAGTYSITLTVTDAGSPKQTAMISKTLTISSQVSPDFSIVASATSLTVNNGQTASSTVSVTSLSGFSGVVNLASSINPSAGLSCTLTPASLTGSGTTTLSCTASTTGLFNVTVKGTSGSLSHSTTVAYNIQDFVIVASAPPASNVGVSSTSTITLTPLNGFTGIVTLTDAVPSGLGCGSITPGSLTGSGTATIACNSNVAGSYSVTITGRSGSLVHSAMATFSFIQPIQPDFIIAASTPTSVSAGQTTTSTITLTSVNGFTGTIALSDTVPTGLNCNAISPSSLSGSGTATLSCSSASQNVYTVTIKGTSGSLSHSATAMFAFGAPPSFTVSATSPAPVNAGSASTSSITLTPINGFAGTVALTDTVPAGMSCSAITPSSLTSSSTATVSCSSSTASTYTLTITGTSGGIIQSTTATFNVVDFIVSANPSTLALNTGISGTTTITITALNGFAGTVSITATPSAGLTVALSTGTIPSSGTSTLTASSGVAGAYTVLVKATSGSLTKTTTVTVTVGAQALPVVSAPSAETVSQLNTLTFTVTGTESSNLSPTLTLSASQLPPGASFTTVQGTSPLSAMFKWTPTATVAPGTYTAIFAIDDGVSSSQAIVSITVVASDHLPILVAPGRQNATVGGKLHFSVSANDPSGAGGPIILSATGLVSNMVFDPSTGDFSFTPSTTQAGQTFTVNFTATDSNNQSWTSTQSVPIQVQSGASGPSGGGLCLSCLLPTRMTTTAWLLAIGALIGIVSSIALVP